MDSCNLGKRMCHSQVGTLFETAGNLELLCSFNKLGEPLFGLTNKDR